MSENIKAAEAQLRRVIWRICCGGLRPSNYQEDRFEAAAEHVLRAYKESFTEEAGDCAKKPYPSETFRRPLPSIEIERVTQFEYKTKWFPPINPA
jgi:hypothetical protein